MGEVTPIPRIYDAFATLRSMGIPVMLNTGFDAVVSAYLLDRLGWSTSIDGIVTADDVQAGRPEPDMIFRSMDLMDLRDANRVITVGDTANDIQAGHRAKVGATIGVLTGAHDRARLEAAGPTAILPTAADVPAWLGLTQA